MQVKKDYVEGIGDSLDLVPIGGAYLCMRCKTTHTNSS